MKRLLSGRILPVLKCAFAAALIWWMIASGRLAPAQILRALGHWPELAVAMALFYTQVLLGAWRWNLLLAAQNLRLTYREAFSLTMIGLLFNVVIPGAVGGDVIKGYYVARRSEGRRSAAVTTILMDRVLGLLGLLLLAAGAAALSFPRLRSSRATEVLGLLAMALAAGGLAGVSLAIFAGGRIHLPMGRNRLIEVAAKILLALRAYQRRIGVLAGTIGLSVAGHMLACCAFYLATRALGAANLPLHYFFLIVPLGLMTTAVPLSPAGIGVGQAAFFTLFQMVPGGDATLGANAFTVFQSVFLLVYLTGFYSYLSYKEKPGGLVEAEA